MSDYGERLKALRKAKYPDFSEDMDMHDITDSMSWMADRIEELEAKLAKANDHIEGLEELLWAAEKDASEAEAYAGELEAKLAKAVGALEVLSDYKNLDTSDGYYDGGCSIFSYTARQRYGDFDDFAHTTLAELTSSVAADNQVKGGKHD